MAKINRTVTKKSIQRVNKVKIYSFLEIQHNRQTINILRKKQRENPQIKKITKEHHNSH